MNLGSELAELLFRNGLIRSFLYLYFSITCNTINKIKLKKIMHSKLFFCFLRQKKQIKIMNDLSLEALGIDFSCTKSELLASVSNADRHVRSCDYDVARARQLAEESGVCQTCW